MRPEPTPLLRLEDLDRVLAGPGPVLLFKHSTACPISAWAHREFRQWLATAASPPPTALVRVIEERPVSNAIAQRLGVGHQSPQAILVVDGRAVWNASHHEITVASLETAVAGKA
jgi:bacillithiol system protein YtxJ